MHSSRGTRSVLLRPGELRRGTKQRVLGARRPGTGTTVTWQSWGASFPVRDVTLWPDQDHDEQIGSKDKVWLGQPGSDVEYLFKHVRGNDSGHPSGEDWAEKLGAELAGVIGLPAAEVDLAVLAGDRGLVCRRMNDPTVERLDHGNELLTVWRAWRRAGSACPRSTSGPATFSSTPGSPTPTGTTRTGVSSST